MVDGGEDEPSPEGGRKAHWRNSQEAGVRRKADPSSHCPGQTMKKGGLSCRELWKRGSLLRIARKLL